MKTVLLPLMIPLLLMRVSTPCDNYTDLQRLNLKGAVKSVETVEYELEDKNGKLERTQELRNSRKYEFFNLSGQKTKEIENIVFGEDNWGLKDDWGGGQTIVNKDTLVYTTMWDYSNPTQIAEVHFKNGELLSRRVSKIKDGRITETQYFSKDGTMETVAYISYSGNKQTTVFKNSNGCSSTNTKEYNGLLLLSSISKDSKGWIGYTLRFKYNENGDAIESYSLDGKSDVPDIIMTQYEYDSFNNWTRAYHHNTTMDRHSITLRNIDYYR